MPTTDITNAARITYRCTQDYTGEIFQFGFAVAKRDPAVQSDMIDRMEEGWTDAVGGLLKKVHLVEIVYSEWGTSGFVGFHQKMSKPFNLAAGSDAPLPPQCAVVVTLLNTTDLDISLKRRRGRYYLGLIGVGQLDATGKLTTVQQDAFLALAQGLDKSVRDTVPVSGLPDGTCIASPAEGKLITADLCGVGLGIDTQRRRRKKIVESIKYDAIDAISGP